MNKTDGGVGGGSDGCPGSQPGGCGEKNWPAWLEVAKRYDEMLQIRERALEIEAEYQKQKKLQEEGLQHRITVRIDKKLEKKHETARKFLDSTFPRFEWKVAEHFYKLLEKKPEDARKLAEFIYEIAKDYGYTPLIADVSATLRNYAHINKTRCRSKFTRAMCGEICEKAKIFYNSSGEPLIVYNAPITIITHMDIATGKVLKTEVRRGHRYVKIPWDPYIVATVTRTYEKRVIKGEIARAAAKLGYYCPYLLATTKSLPAEEHIPTPEPTPDHFPEDVTAQVDDDGAFSRVWLSAKHASEEVTA